MRDVAEQGGSVFPWGFVGYNLSTVLRGGTLVLVQAVAGRCRSFLGEEGSVSTLTLLPVTWEKELKGSNKGKKGLGPCPGAPALEHRC